MARQTAVNPFSLSLIAGCSTLAALGGVPAHDISFSLAWPSGSLVLRALGPHLYLIAAQVVCEFFSNNKHVARLPLMLVPIGFNTYRMWTLIAWCKAVVAADMGSFHVCLAFGNLLFWAFNLFVFLLLKMVPLYLNPEKAAV
eukprot:GHUV01030236.1.p2 GENE.GHUV01030236.1~~GHUV01030236.1.p2  ORF type:complete len:142 (-),score=27.49 GHUV01030236.1:1117-1542(-)